MQTTDAQAATYFGHPILFDCPGYTIFKAPAHRTFKHGDVIAIPFTALRGDTLYSFYTLGHVWGFYSTMGNTEIQSAVAEARERGHELYWASQNATIISDPPQKKSAAPGFNFGDVITFQGRRFRLESTANGNCGLVEVTTSDGPYTADLAAAFRVGARELLNCNLGDRIAVADDALVEGSEGGGGVYVTCRLFVTDAERAALAGDPAATD